MTCLSRGKRARFTYHYPGCHNLIIFKNLLCKQEKRVYKSIYVLNILIDEQRCFSVYETSTRRRRRRVDVL